MKDATNIDEHPESARCEPGDRAGAAGSNEPLCCTDDVRVRTLQAAEDCLQAVAEQSEELGGQESLPVVSATHDAQLLAMSPGVQALWQALLPLVGAMPSRPGEYPGVFKVEAGESDNEAVVFIDVPATAYEPGRRGDMDRVLALKVTLDHDYRRLGDHYYCIDCEAPAEETRH
jgi:hypothetical protein